MAGSQDFAADPLNAAALVWVNGALVPKAEAKVSIFDAGFVLGDGVWEGLRLHHGKLMFLETHLDRLFAGAAAIELDIGLTRQDLKAAFAALFAANGMEDGVHIRIMVTRGEKSAANQDPRNALGRPTVVIIAEWKTPSPNLAATGLNLATVSIRCTPKSMFDMALNSHSRLNLIMALQEAIRAGADEALMLDPLGNVASCNATNLFWVRDGRLRTATGEFCFNGVTRANVIMIAQGNSLPMEIGDFLPGDVALADEAFVTGTFGGLTPVRSIDGRRLPGSLPGPITNRLRGLYEALKNAEAAR